MLSFYEAIAHHPVDLRLTLVFTCALCFTLILVTAIYWSRGQLVVCRIVAYIVCLTTIKISVKNVCQNYNFIYPWWLNSAHFLVSGGVAWGYIIFRTWYGISDRPPPYPNGRIFFSVIIPVASAFALGTYFNNEALVFSKANFVEMIGSTGPLCTAGLLFLTASLDLTLCRPLTLVAVGLFLCASGELEFSVVAFSFAMLANVFRSVKVLLQQHLMTKNACRSEFDPIELLAWMSMPAVFISGIVATIAEGYGPYHLLAPKGILDWKLICAIGLTCCQAALLNVFACFAVRDLGAVGAQLAAQLKGCLALVGGTALLGEQIALQQVIGFTVILVGVAWYTRLDKAIKEQASQNKLTSFEKGSTNNAFNDVSFRNNNDPEAPPAMMKETTRLLGARHDRAANTSK